MMPAACHNAIIDGLEMLYALRLAFAPAEAQIDACIDAWLVTLAPYCQDEADAARLRQAFVRLAGDAVQWPAPKALIDRLPDRPQPRPLPPPPVGAQERQRNLAVLEGLMTQIAARSGVLKTGGQA